MALCAVLVYFHIFLHNVIVEKLKKSSIGRVVFWVAWSLRSTAVIRNRVLGVVTYRNYFLHDDDKGSSYIELKQYYPGMGYGIVPTFIV